MNKQKELLKETLLAAKKINGSAHRIEVILYVADGEDYYDVDITNWERDNGGLGHGETLEQAASKALRDFQKGLSND